MKINAKGMVAERSALLTALRKAVKIDIEVDG